MEQRHVDVVMISETEIETYQRDGAVLLKNVLDDSELALLRQGVEEAHDHPSGRESTVRGEDGKGGTVTDQFPSLVSPSLKALIDAGRIAEIAARAMRVSSAQLVLDQIHYKEAGPILPTPWHQDTPFLRVRGIDMVRVWLPCDPSPSDITVQVVRGSHRWNVVYDVRSDAKSKVVMASEGSDFTYSGIGDDRFPPVPDIELHCSSFDILTWDVEPGDVLVFNGNMLHGAAGRSSHPIARRAFVSMWGGPDLRYHQPQGHSFPSIGELAGYDVPHGARIGDHPKVFPIHWAMDQS